MNPYKLREIYNSLTRDKKADPELPNVIPARTAPIPPVKQEVQDIQAVNKFMLRNPRVEKAGGGMLVQPGFGGTRQGYAESREIKQKKEGKYENVYKNKQGDYVYKSGSGDDRIYKSSFKTPEAASKWGQKEFVKKFSLPNKFVNAGELGEILGISKTGSGTISPFFERSDRPNYLLQEARKILGSYKTGKSNFFRAPTKKEIEYLKKYNTSPIIPNQVGKNVQLILDSKAIMNDLTGKNKSGKTLPNFKKIQKVFANAGIEASDAVIANALQKTAYLLRGDSYQTTVNFNKDRATGNFIIKEIEKLPFDNQYTRGIYKHALQEISKELGDTAGNLDSFKRNFKKRLPKDFLEKHNLNVNEIFSIRASVRNKSYPYAYFIDVIDADINQKALRSFHGALSNAQTNLNNKIKDVRAGKAKYDDVVEIVEKFNGTRDKFKETIKTNYPNKPFNLPNIVLGKESEILKSNMKIPSDVYSKKLLDKWQNQGLDITGHAKKTGYVMTGAADKGVFTAQDLSRNPEIRKQAISEIENKIIQNIQSYSKLPECKIGKAEGGRIGFANSITCIQDGLKEQKIAAQNGNKKAAEELIQVGKVASRGALLKNLLGPGAILGEAVYEGALIGNKVLGGKPADIAYAESYLSYLDPRKYRGELDPLKMEREDMLESTADKNILRSGFAAQDQISDFNKAIEERDLAKARGRIDQYMPAAADAREQGRLVDQSADIISSEAFKDATNVAQEYLQGQSGQQQADFGVYSVPQSAMADERRRLQAMNEMKNLYPQYSDKDILNILKEYNLNPKDYDYTYTPKNFPADTSSKPLTGFDDIRNFYQKEQATQNIADAGGVANLAEGGVASGPPPLRGPNPQGLLSLKNRVRNY